jgi:hypothetical protein
MGLGRPVCKIGNNAADSKMNTTTFSLNVTGARTIEFRLLLLLRSIRYEGC